MNISENSTTTFLFNGDKLAVFQLDKEQAEDLFSPFFFNIILKVLAYAIRKQIRHAWKRKEEIKLICYQITQLFKQKKNVEGQVKTFLKLI